MTNEQIRIRVLGRRAISIGAEKNDALRVELPAKCYFITGCLDGVAVDHFDNISENISCFLPKSVRFFAHCRYLDSITNDA